MARRKTWREKLANDNGLPRVGPIDERMRKTWGSGAMVIPAPREVDSIMKSVPKGKLITINEIRKRVAAAHEVDVGCPITCGIFAWIAAHAAEEAASEGAKRITPYWRTLKSRGELNPKYPGGIAAQRKRLEEEGHRVVARGKKFVVQDYEKSLSPEIQPTQGRNDGHQSNSRRSRTAAAPAPEGPSA